MTTESSSPAILLLEDGTICHGKSFGALGITTGEICFNTGMTGYQEVFTDPSYYGQILIMNTAHVGNYGVRSTDVESETVKIAGLIGRNLEEGFSRKMADGSLHHYLKDNNIVSIRHVDTRNLVAHIRAKGAMNCLISSTEMDIQVLKAMLDKVPSMEGLELASKVSSSQSYEVGNPQASIRVAVMDYGTKRNIIQCMVDRGAFVKVFPAKTPLDEIRAFNPDGYFLSNGPGDPATMDYAVETAKEIIAEDKPVFGICLGHQIIALANGLRTHKMHHGHRGLNHPVKNLQRGTSEITTQNHGFAVSADSISENENMVITHINLNDQSIEGLRIKDKPVFSVQYHPESTPGPHDSRYLFDEFIKLMKN